MERNTLTTLGELRLGDRFTFQKRADIWQVTGNLSKKTTMVNQVNPDGHRIHLYDQQKNSSTQVRFLRHTLPLPGEQCVINDLNEGDVFITDADILTELVVLKKEYPRIYIKAVNNEESEGIITWGAIVTFMRHKTVTNEPSTSLQ